MNPVLLFKVPCRFAEEYTAAGLYSCNMTAEDVTAPPGAVAPRATLQQLFNSVDNPIDNPSETCARVIPYVRQALIQTPSSRQLQETLAFLQCGVTQATHATALAAAAATGETATETGAEAEAEADAPAPWTCSNGELHAIIHMLNDEQLLIEDRDTTSAANTDTIPMAITPPDVDGLDGLEGALAATVLLPAPVPPTEARLADTTSSASTADDSAASAAYPARDVECERDAAFLDELRDGAASDADQLETYPGQHEEAENEFLRELEGSEGDWQ